MLRSIVSAGLLLSITIATGAEAASFAENLAQAVPRVAQYSGSGYGVIKEAIDAVVSNVIAVPSLLSGAMDTRPYTELIDNIYRFRGVAVVSEQAKGVHGTNEYIGVDSFEQSIVVAKQMMKLGAGTP